MTASEMGQTVFAQRRKITSPANRTKETHGEVWQALQTSDSRGINLSLSVSKIDTPPQIVTVFAPPVDSLIFWLWNGTLAA